MLINKAISDIHFLYVRYKKMSDKDIHSMLTGDYVL